MSTWRRAKLMIWVCRALHAEIRMLENGIFLADLDSVNGTMVNGRKLEPQSPSPLRHGDILQLGRMRLQLITRRKS